MAEDERNSSCNKVLPPTAVPPAGFISVGAPVNHTVTDVMTSACATTRASPTAADSGVIKHIRNYGRATLVDFGLARWLPAPASLVSPHSSGDTRALSPTPGISPVSPNPITRGNSATSFTFLGGELFPTIPTEQQQAQHLQQTIFMSCCGSDKYMAPEMLKWHIEHFNSTSASMQSASAAATVPLVTSAGLAATNRKPVPIAHAMKMDVYSIGVVAYALLSGCLPYSGKTRAAIAAQQQSTVAPKMNSQHWHGVSSEAKRFVTRLLATDVLERCSVEEALDDAWLASPAALCSKLHIVPEPLSGAPLTLFSAVPATLSSSTTGKTALHTSAGRKSPLNQLSPEPASSVRLDGMNSRSGSAHAAATTAESSGSELQGAVPVSCFAAPHAHQEQQRLQSPSSRSGDCDESAPCLPVALVNEEPPVVLSFSKSSMRT
jgi:serine/threonine protein kinase